MNWGDFHIHSNWSDGRLSIPALVDLYGPRGYAAIAITDHAAERKSWLGRAAHLLGRSLSAATFEEYLAEIAREDARAERLYGMRLIPGVELTQNTLDNHRSAHMLLLWNRPGDARWIDPGDDVVTLARRGREAGATVVAAHPVWTRVREKQSYHLWDRRAELRPWVDAWEVASGRHLFPEVVDEIRAGGLPWIASSDLHRPEQVSAWKTRFARGRRHPADILAEIRAQRIRADYDFRPA